MKWAPIEPTPPYKDEETTQIRDSFQYAGPLRIPPASFQIRSRKELNANDTMNSRLVESNGASLKVQQDQYIRENIQMKDVKESVFFDMAPLSSRTDKRDFRQSKPYDSTGPSLAENPFFDRYDPTRDPRNMVREVRSVVYEDKEADRGIKESERIRERTFTNRNQIEGSTSISLTEWADLLRPKIDNAEIVYRGTGELWSLGSKDELKLPANRPH